MIDQDGNASTVGEVFLAVERVHQLLHVMDVTPDSPFMTVALDERDVLMLCAALPVLELFYPCLHNLSAHFQARILELARAQNPDFEWFQYGDHRFNQDVEDVE